MARLVLLLIAALLIVGTPRGAFALAAGDPCTPDCGDDTGTPCCPDVCACCVHPIPVRAPAPAVEARPATSTPSLPVRGTDEDAPPSPEPPALLHVPRA